MNSVAFSPSLQTLKQPRFGALAKTSADQAKQADIFPGSGHDQGCVPFVSKANNIRITTAPGKGQVPNVWNNNSPVTFQEGDAVMFYGLAKPDGSDQYQPDMAVSADPGIMARTYMDKTQTRYLNSGTEENPVLDVPKGEFIDAVKRAPGKALLAPIGTKVHSAETVIKGLPPVTVNEGQIVLFDVDGNPYVQSINNFFLKKNDPTPGNDQSANFFKTLAEQAK